MVYMEVKEVGGGWCVPLQPAVSVSVSVSVSVPDRKKRPGRLAALTALTALTLSPCLYNSPPPARLVCRPD